MRLYKASQAGVKIQLLVRSICCLAPGVPGQSDNIEVRRIVDRYLEHARVFLFHNDGYPELFMGSADWMNRNLHSRIEVVFPVYDIELKEELMHILQLQLRDNTKAVFLTPDLENEYIRSENGQEQVTAQLAIYNFIKGQVKPVAV